MQAESAILGHQDSPNTEPKPYTKGKPKKRKPNPYKKDEPKKRKPDIPVQEQLNLLEQYHTRKKTSIEFDLDHVKRVLVNNIKNNAGKFERHKQWVEALCAEIGYSTTTELEKLKASITKELEKLKASINKVHEDGKSNSENIFTVSQHIVKHHKALHDVHRLIKEDRRQVSCIATKFRNDMAKLQTDMAKVLDQNSKLQERIVALEAKLQST
jgi:chromosome segregation ATPase